MSGPLVFAGGAPADLLIRGAHVLDPSGERWLEGVDVLITGQRMVRIAPAKEIVAPDGAQRLDLTGLYLIPGLIDLHSHLLLHPYDETVWSDQVLHEPLALRIARATVHARETLRALPVARRNQAHLARTARVRAAARAEVEALYLDDSQLALARRVLT